MSILTERPNRAMPLSAMAAGLNQAQRVDLLRVLRWYADPANNELECNGYVPIAGTSSLEDDGGKRARDCLKRMGLQ